MVPKSTPEPPFSDFRETLIFNDSTMVFHGFCPPEGVRKRPKIDENTVPKIIRKKMRKKSENGGLEARFWELFGHFLTLVLEVSF